MHAMLLFLGVWGGYVAFSALFVAVVIWASSIDEDAQGKKVGSDVLRAIFWPFIWLYLRITNRDALFGKRPEGSSEQMLAGSHAATVVLMNPPARRFQTVRDAKDYLASRIVDEAKREGATLTEVEQKMLSFSERGSTLADMKTVSAEFDRDYDQGEYERRIGALASRIQARDEEQAGPEQEAWDAAVEKLSRGDHYLLVLINASPATQTAESWSKHSLRVVAAALVLCAFAALDLWFRHWMRDH